MNVPRTYWLTVGWFGSLAVANGLLDVGEHGQVRGAVTVAAGLVILALGARGLRDPADTGGPREPGLSLYLGLLAAGAYTVATVVRFL